MTVGLVLLVTLIAFEALAVNTVMPKVKDELGGLALYGWVFSAFTLSTLVSISVSGREADRRGLAPVLATGVVLFSIGLVGGGAAPAMGVVVGARVVQGLGAGAISSVANVAIGRAYPEWLRPRLLAVLSTSWVLPGLLGPSVAAVIATYAGWRYVFVGLLPLVALGARLALPALRAHGPLSAEAQLEHRGAARSHDALMLAAGAGLVLAGLSGARALAPLALVPVGLLMLGRALRRLTPPGTFRLRPGPPTAIALNGIMSAAFFATDAFMPLAVTDVRGRSIGLAGAALAAGAALLGDRRMGGRPRLAARGCRRARPHRFAAGGFGDRRGDRCAVARGARRHVRRGVALRRPRHGPRLPDRGAGRPQREGRGGVGLHCRRPPGRRRAGRLAGCGARRVVRRRRRGFRSLDRVRPEHGLLVHGRGNGVRRSGQSSVDRPARASSTLRGESALSSLSQQGVRDWLQSLEGSHMSETALAQSLNALARFVVGDNTVEETLQRVSELTVDAMPGADLVGITMIVDGKPQTSVFTDSISPEIDQAQYDSGEGPCLDSFRHQRVETIESTSEVGRWPEFRKAAADHGIGSTLSLPLVIDNNGVGALNLYAKKHRAFGEDDVRAASLFASQAAIVLANAQTYWEARTLGEHLGEAMKSRAVIEQAKGILMAAQRCGEDEAFNLLVRASQRENVKLREIATRIVAGATQPSGGVR